MSTTTAPANDQLHEALRKELLRLALDEEDAAAREAEHVQYWEPAPVAVAIHRHCAVALRAAADALLVPPPPAPVPEDRQD